MLHNLFFTCLLVLFLTSCVSTQDSADSSIDRDHSLLAWRVSAQDYVPAVRSLVSRADGMIEAGQYDDAITVLNRSLRIDNRTATVWSRLAWLSQQQGRSKNARDYVRRSNSLTSEVDLLRFNWMVYRQASEALGDTRGMQAAQQQLQAL